MCAYQIVEHLHLTSRLVQSTSKSQSLLIKYPDIWRGVFAIFTEAFQMPTNGEETTDYIISKMLSN
jgi:hypothetical protein